MKRRETEKKPVGHVVMAAADRSVPQRLLSVIDREDLSCVYCRTRQLRRGAVTKQVKTERDNDVNSEVL
ncbi:MAG: hypothetical protein OEU26_32785 [Candidatus Tectomicrobia bacterium]|nr:hypothetical protein [Candidatus Tectomicrobia bacterium]